MRCTHLLLLVPIAALLSVVGCKQNKVDTGDGTDSTNTAAPVALRIVKGESDPSAPDVKLSITTPGPGEVVKGDSVTVKALLTGYDLGSPTNGEQSKGIAYSKEGQHIHIIIDDKPYMAMYDTAGFSVGPLAEGVHTIRAFPSRSWHESIKKTGAFDAHTFYVKSKKGTPVLNDSLPLLTYSRPKGDYKGPDDTKRILLDFYLSNAQLGKDKYKVIASVDNKLTDTLTDWVPYYIEGLAAGAHTVKLELVGPDGKPVVNGPFNSVERTINVMPTETAGTPPAAGGTPQATMGGDSMKMGGTGDTAKIH